MRAVSADTERLPNPNPEHSPGATGAAIDALFVAHYEELYRVAYYFVRSREAAEELVQDVFVHVIELGSRWEPRGPALVYLRAAVRNAALGTLRRQRLEQRWTIDRPFGTDVATAPTASADDLVHGLDVERAIARAVAALPPRCRETFQLQRESGLTYDEVAHVMGVTAQTVKIQMGRALKALRRSLRHYLPNPNETHEQP